MRFNEIIESYATSKMYHITPTKNVPIILKQGLYPTSGDEDSSYSDEERLYLWPTLEDAKMAIKDWAIERFNEPISSLEVNTSGIEVNPTMVEWEVYTLDAIPPERIRVVNL